MRSFFTFSAVALLMVTLVAGCQQSTEPTAEPAPDAGEPEVTLVNFANETCPMMGGKPTEELTRQWNGKTIGFCCEGCPEKWDELSEEEKAAKFAEASSGDQADQHGDHEHGEHKHGEHKHGDHEHGDHEHGDHEHGDHESGSGDAEPTGGNPEGSQPSDQ